MGGPTERESEQVNQALAAFGLAAESAVEVDEPFYLWPDNADVLEWWFVVQTQWNRSHGGHRTGLNYEAVQAAMRMKSVPRKRQVEIFEGLQVMEVAALNEWNEQRG